MHTSTRTCFLSICHGNCHLFHHRIRISSSKAPTNARLAEHVLKSNMATFGRILRVNPMLLNEILRSIDRWRFMGNRSERYSRPFFEFDGNAQQVTLAIFDESLNVLVCFDAKCV